MNPERSAAQLEEVVLSLEEENDELRKRVADLEYKLGEARFCGDFLEDIVADAYRFVIFGKQRNGAAEAALWQWRDLWGKE